MRPILLMFILTSLLAGFHAPLHADEAGIGWGDGDGLTTEEPASEDSTTDTDGWFGQLLELLVME